MKLPAFWESRPKRPNATGRWRKRGCSRRSPGTLARDLQCYVDDGHRVTSHGFGAPKSLRLARGALPGVSFLCLDEVIQLAPAVCAQQLEQAPVALQSHVAELGEVCCHPSPALL